MQTVTRGFTITGARLAAGDGSYDLPTLKPKGDAVKILFLDFDGVILTYRTLLASPHMGHSKAAPDPMLCSLIRRACELGLRIVVSSTWRSMELACKEKLIEAGLLEYLHADWRTTDQGESRPKEISDWMADHPEVTDYRIADDDDFQWAPEQDAKWLKCSPYDGMPAMVMKDFAEWAGVVRTKRQPLTPTPEPGDEL